MLVVLKRINTALLVASVSLMALLPASAETLTNALAKAYNNNASLNSGRAGVRVTDEEVAIAKSGYRPTIEGSANAFYRSRDGSRSTNTTVGINVNQRLFNGFQTKNRVKSAESQVYAARENLRSIEQQVLFDATAAYLDVIRDRKIAALRKKNVAFLVEQLRSAKARFEVGEGTRTDVAQADASRAAAIAQLNAADAQVKASSATYREVIGENPKDLKAPTAASKLMPKSLDAALTAAATENPVIGIRKHQVDAALSGVKVAEGQLLPTLDLQAGVQTERVRSGNAGVFNPNGETGTASVGVSLNVPIYQGGRVAAQVRQAKESLGQARIDVDVANDSTRSAVTSAWTQFEALKASVIANKQVVAAAQLALDGVVEERKVGQRTTLDVLNAQSDVVSAQLNLVSSERDVVLASYAILQTTGRLSASRLSLGVKLHKPEEHYEAVKDKWFGLRTPDQR